MRQNSRPHKLKLLTLITLTVLSLVLIVIGLRLGNQSAEPTVIINNHSIPVEVVDKNPERAAGLSNRERLAENKGMLFIFEESDRYAFWMKGMHFAIDIAWIDEQKRIVNIAPSLSPQTYPKAFKPAHPAKYVLEVNAGYFQQYGIKVSDTLTFKNID